MIDILDDLLGPAPAAERGALEASHAPVLGTDTCGFCGAHPMATCNACGRSMCREHSWTMLGLCTGCAREERIDYFQRTPDPEDRNWLEDP